jgi:predicted acylesterase/phospholipase RssA
MNYNYDTIVLPGGGMKGFALLGGVQACLDRDLLRNIKTYVGTSIGASICYCLSIGYTPIEIMTYLHLNKYIEKMKHFNILDMINGLGATSFNPMAECLEKMSLEKIGKLLTLSKLKEEYGKTLICVSYNMTTSSVEYVGPENYPDLPCITAIRMSANIPFIFERFKYMDNYYVDGGIIDNFPIEYGNKICENSAIGFDLKVDCKNFKDEPSEGMLSYILKLFQIMINQKNTKETELKKSKIIPIFSKDMFGSFDFGLNIKTRLDLFSNGYNDVRLFIEENQVKDT